MAPSLMNRFRRPLSTALASGTFPGVLCYLGGPTVSSLVSGIGGFIGSLVATALNRLRRMFSGNCGWDGSADHLS